MLRVLTAQAADEAAAFTPGNPYRADRGCHPSSRGLAPEEPPPLPVRSSSVLTPFGRRARVGSQRGQSLGVGPGQLDDPRVDGERERAVEVRGVSLFDQFLELVPQRRGELGDGRPLEGRLPDEGADRVRAGRELSPLTELVE